MSAKLMGAVWDLDLSHQNQSVLLALADHAHDDGTRCYPGVPYLAWKTGYSERNVTRVLAALEQDGIIEVVSGRGGGKGYVTEYVIHIEKGDKKSPFSGNQRVTSRASAKGDKSDKRVTDETPKGDKSDTKGDKSDNGLYIHAGAVEPSDNHKEPSVVTATPPEEPSLPDDETSRCLLLLSKVKGFPKNQADNALFLAELRAEFPGVNASETCNQYRIWHRDNPGKTKNFRGRLRSFFKRASEQAGHKPRSSEKSNGNGSGSGLTKQQAQDERRRQIAAIGGTV